MKSQCSKILLCRWLKLFHAAYPVKYYTLSVKLNESSCMHIVIVEKIDSHISNYILYIKLFLFPLFYNTTKHSQQIIWLIFHILVAKVSYFPHSHISALPLLICLYWQISSLGWFSTITSFITQLFKLSPISASFIYLPILSVSVASILWKKK